MKWMMITKSYITGLIVGILTMALFDVLSFYVWIIVVIIISTVGVMITSREEDEDADIDSL